MSEIDKDINVPNKNDSISRRAALDALNMADDKGQIHSILDVNDVIKSLPSAQPERLTDDDFETIRIHLNAYKEKLCNQHRWEEAEEYQRIIDRFMAVASAQPQRIKGRWIDDGLYSDNFPHHAWHCSECEESVLEIDEPWFKFCPSCGADMRKDGERNDTK